jgi:hypothetical protein
MYPVTLGFARNLRFLWFWQVFLIQSRFDGVLQPRQSKLEAFLLNEGHPLCVSGQCFNLPAEFAIFSGALEKICGT